MANTKDYQPDPKRALQINIKHFKRELDSISEWVEQDNYSKADEYIEELKSSLDRFQTKIQFYEYQNQ